MATGGFPSVGLGVWVEVTVLVTSWGVVSGLVWVLTELDGGGSGDEGSDKSELHIFNLLKTIIISFNILIKN